MRHIFIICFCFSLFSCIRQNLKEENKELLELTKDLTSTVEELKIEVEKQQELAMSAAANARAAEANALIQVTKSREEAEQQRLIAERLAEKLEDCQ